MISIPGSLSFAKLVMMSSAPAKSAGDARYMSQDPFIHRSQHTLVPEVFLNFSPRERAVNIDCPIQSQLQSILGMRSFYVERNDIIKCSKVMWNYQVLNIL